MSIDTTWLRCPNCFLPLSRIDDRVLGCDTGHRFDIARHDTVTLLPPRAPHTVGDHRAMLEARRALLDSGLYRRIADAIVRAAGAAGSVGDVAPPRIADLGCGTGYYARRLADQYPDGVFLLADRSPAAVRIATRDLPGSTGVVLDLWRPLPIRDESADLAINVFAPHNPTEFARMLRRGGVLVVVVPTVGHLRELRATGPMLDIPGGKDADVTARFVAAGFSRAGAERVEYRAPIDAGQRAALIGMGPSAHHAARSDRDRVQSTASDAPDSDLAIMSTITISIDVLAFRRDSVD